MIAKNVFDQARSRQTTMTDNPCNLIQSSSGILADAYVHSIFDTNTFQKGRLVVREWDISAFADT